MAKKIGRVVCFSNPLETFLLAVAVFILNLFILSEYDQNSLDLTPKDYGHLLTKAKADVVSGKQLKNIVRYFKENDFIEKKPEQIITIEEDGRFGNLLMETATLLLIGKKLNRRVQLLPDVSKKLRNYFSSLPAETVDFSEVGTWNIIYKRNISRCYLNILGLCL